MTKAVLLFIVGLICLIKGGDWFVDGATGVARRFHVPEVLIGATVVSIGTTLPEVMVSSQAALANQGAVAYGNAIGSIICNTALIAAITIAIKPGPADSKNLKTPIIFFFTAAVFYCAVAYFIGEYTRTVGILLLIVFVLYMITTIRSAVKESNEIKSQLIDVDLDDKDNGEAEIDGETPMWKTLVFLVLGAAVIAIGADLLVDNGTIIAQGLGVPESVIALTFVALGTSLPEFITAITALIKGHSALSLGNIVGANLFNLILVSGMAITLNPFNLPAEKQIAGMNASLVIDIPVAFTVMLLLTIPVLKKEKTYRWQGILLLIIYTAFVGFQFLG